MAVNRWKYGARGRNRTGTIVTNRGILSPLRLPISPPGHWVLFFYVGTGNQLASLAAGPCGRYRRPASRGTSESIHVVYQFRHPGIGCYFFTLELETNLPALQLVLAAATGVLPLAALVNPFTSSTNFATRAWIAFY
jgi:hypothetical protein